MFSLPFHALAACYSTSYLPPVIFPSMAPSKPKRNPKHEIQSSPETQKIGQSEDGQSVVHPSARENGPVDEVRERKNQKRKKEKRKREVVDDGDNERGQCHGEGNDAEEKETGQEQQQPIKKTFSNGGSGIMTAESFFSLPISQPTKDAIKDIGFVNMTQVIIISLSLLSPPLEDCLLIQFMS